MPFDRIAISVGVPPIPIPALESIRIIAQRLLNFDQRAKGISPDPGLRSKGGHHSTGAQEWLAIGPHVWRKIRDYFVGELLDSCTSRSHI